MLSKLKLNQLYFKDTQFANLMTRRIFNVLLIANPYDAFSALSTPLYPGIDLRGSLGTTLYRTIRSHHLYAGNGR